MLGTLKKMKTVLDQPVQYTLPVGEQRLPLNPLLGQSMGLNFTGNIFCTHCNRKTKKSFNQGYCYPCFRKLARCDTCIIKPEQCHFAEGTCREPEWAQQFCFRPHYVYLANTSGLKVGITRCDQVPVRWIDQGANQALAVVMVTDRRLSGLLEVIIARQVADKTNWRAMLKNTVEPLDLVACRDRLLEQLSGDIEALASQFQPGDLSRLVGETPVDIVYPVLEYPSRVSSLNAEKTPNIGGTLQGIKGQYLIFDTGVINIRKYTGYEVEVTA